MPFRPEAELKRPDLKGEFLCGHCGKTFCHAASLNRHRLNFHGDDQHCRLCDKKLEPHETVRKHMSTLHQIPRVFTCSCCNWSFVSKKELHAHNNNMMRTGEPGDAPAIAVSSRVPGSLAQPELRGEASRRSPASSQRSATTTPPTTDEPPQSKEQTPESLGAVGMTASTSTASAPMAAALSMEWLNAFLLNNPSMLPFLTQTSALGALSALAQETATSATTSGASSNHSDELLFDEKPLPTATLLPTSFPPVFGQLEIKTEETLACGPESGIGSSEGVTDSSPAPSDYSKDDATDSMSITSGPPSERKRKSIDVIAARLFKKKLMME